MKVLETECFNEKVVKAEEYLRMIEDPEKKENIKSAEIIPPKLGRSSFGKIRIKFNIPTYQVKL